jgi:hypothetical protein
MTECFIANLTLTERIAIIQRFFSAKQCPGNAVFITLVRQASLSFTLSTVTRPAVLQTSPETTKNLNHRECYTLEILCLNQGESPECLDAFKTPTFSRIFFHLYFLNSVLHIDFIFMFVFNQLFSTFSRLHCSQKRKNPKK